MLHELVARHAQSMLAALRDADPDGGGLPRVERELAAYLRCGILAHGFTRVRCQTCHDEIVVAFSCKRRGLCPSCTSRRMADTAAHLVDRVLPEAPYRQWVFTVPKPLRLVLARDPAWTRWTGALVVRAIAAWQRRVARKRGLPFAAGRRCHLRAVDGPAHPPRRIWQIHHEKENTSTTTRSPQSASQVGHRRAVMPHRPGRSSEPGAEGSVPTPRGLIERES